MLNRSHLVWVWSTVDLLIAASAALVSLQFEVLQSQHSSLGGIGSVHLSPKNFVLLTLFLVTWTGVHQLCGLYTDRRLSRRALYLGSISAALAGSLFYLLFPFFSTDSQPQLLTPVLIFFSVAAFLSLSARSPLWSRWMLGKRKLNTFIIGSGPLALTLSQSLEKEHSRRHRILGFIDSPTTHTPSQCIARRLLGDLNALESLLMQTHVDEVLVALPLRSCYDQIQQTIAVCERIGVPVTYHYQPFVHRIGFSTISSRHALEPYISYRPSRLEQSQITKRALDLALSLIALVVLTPLFAVIAAAIKLTSQGPVFFVQKRFGLNRQRFRMYKFRTMVPDAEAKQISLEALNEAQGPVFKMKKDPRVTSLGKFLRKTSLDELPQLINVLRGQMSLVGPRPLPLRDVTNFSEASLMRRFSVKPGLTCLWQVNGRSDTSFAQWIALDLQYIDTWSLLLDFRILLRTIPAVIRGSGAM